MKELEITDDTKEIILKVIERIESRGYYSSYGYSFDTDGVTGYNRDPFEHMYITIDNVSIPWDHITMSDEQWNTYQAERVRQVQERREKATEKSRLEKENRELATYNRLKKKFEK